MIAPTSKAYRSSRSSVARACALLAGGRGFDSRREDWECLFRKVAAMKLADLYEKDETAWLEKMARLVREQKNGELDRRNLAEFLDDMAKRDLRETYSRLVTLLIHRLKFEHQPERRSGSWRRTLREQSYRLGKLLRRKTLRHHAEDVLAEAYREATELAALETGLTVEVFPRACPYTLDELLSS